MHPIPNTIISFFQSEFFRQSFLIAQIVSYFILIYFIVAIVYYMRKSGWLKYRYTIDMKEVATFSSATERKSERQWLVIEKKLESASESEWKLAVTEAENLLDETMRRAGFLGDTFGERMQHIEPDQLKNIEDVKQVHEIRNNVVHNPDYMLGLDEAKKVLNVYEESLKELGMF